MFYPTPSSLRDMVIDRSKGVSNMNSSTSARLKRRTSALCLLATTTLTALSAHAATVTLNNGDQISGTLKQLTGDTVIFESAVFGEIKIPFKEVSKLTTDEDVRYGALASLLQQVGLYVGAIGFHVNFKRLEGQFFIGQDLLGISAVSR